MVSYFTLALFLSVWYKMRLQSCLSPNDSQHSQNKDVLEVLCDWSSSSHVICCFQAVPCVLEVNPPNIKLLHVILSLSYFELLGEQDLKACCYFPVFVSE